MDRRVVLASIATLAVSPVLAQSSPPPPTDAPAAPAPADPAAAPPAPAMKVEAPIGGASEASTQHINGTMAVGSLSLAVSRIALTKAKNPMLKQFAGFEVAEQETIADILKGMMMPDTPPNGDVKSPTDAALMGNLDAKGKAAVEKMHAMKAGPEFDREYVKAQIDGHKQLLEIQTAYLKMPNARDETNVAKLASGMIKEHLALLGDLEKKTG